MRKKKVYLIVGPNGEFYARTNKKRAWEKAASLLGFEPAQKTITPGGAPIRYQDICNIERESGELDIYITGPAGGTVRIVMIEINGHHGEH